MYGRVLGPAAYVLLHKMNVTPVPINIITGRRSSRGEVFVTPVFSPSRRLKQQQRRRQHQKLSPRLDP